jgi:hypothetical protein
VSTVREGEKKKQEDAAHFSDGGGESIAGTSDGSGVRLSAGQSHRVTRSKVPELPIEDVSGRMRGRCGRRTDCITPYRTTKSGTMLITAAEVEVSFTSGR